MIQKKEFMDADQAVFHEGFSTVLLQLPSNELPLKKMAGLMDWRFGGVISEFIQQKKITGQEDESILIPVTKSGKNFQLVLIGMGPAKTLGTRQKLTATRFKSIHKNLKTLLKKQSKIYASLSDLGLSTKDDLPDGLEQFTLKLGA